MNLSDGLMEIVDGDLLDGMMIVEGRGNERRVNQPSQDGTNPVP